MKPSAAFMLACLLAGAGLAPTYAEPRSGTSANNRDNRDRIVCRRFLRTGSLVDSYRTCKTNAEWQREHENIQHLSVSNSCRNQMGCDR